jgi:phage gp29-like protein
MTTLLDHNGQPIDMSQVRRALAEQSAEPQTANVAQIWREFEAHPGRGLTPAKLRQYLFAGEKGDLAVQCDLADDMEEGDGHLFAELDKRRMAVGLLDWSVEPPKNATPAEEALAAEVQEWMEMLNVDELLATAADALLKGYSAHELVWSLQEGVLLPQVTHRPGRWFTVDGTRTRLLLRNPAADSQAANAGHFVAPHLLPTPTVAGEPLRPLAWWVHRHRAKSGYISRGALARVLSWPYLYKAYAQRDFAEFLEIYGLPLRIGKYPTGATNEEKNALLRAVTSLGHNAAGIIPMGMALEFQNAAQGQRDPFLAMLNYCDAAESKVLLGQTLSASEGQHGTQALGNVHEGVREDIRDADVKQICASITNGLIKPMVLLNKPNVDPRRLPRFVLDTGDAEDLAKFAEHLPKLAKAGARIGVSWTHEKLRIPQAEPGEEVLSGGEPAPVPGAPGAPGAPPAAPVPPGGKPAAPVPAPAPTTARAQANAALAALATLANQAAKPDLVEQAALDAAQDWEPLLAPLVAPLLAELDAAVSQGESLADFRTRFDALVARMDAAPAGNALALRAFAARLGGEADLDLFSAEEE